MTYKTLEIEKKGSTDILYLNRPDVLNAFSDDMRIELIDYLTKAADDESVHVVVISGKGRAFSAGGDLDLFVERYQSFKKEGQREGFSRRVLPRALIRFPKPIIAAINGVAVGFGATVTLNCDIRLASQKAKFSFAFARLGVTPEFNSSYHLPRLVGFGKAAELVYTAKMIDAEEALQIGLVNQVLAPEDLLPEAVKMAEQIGSFSSPAVQAAKRLMRSGSHSTLEQVVDSECEVLQIALQSKEHYEAVCKMKEALKNKKK